MRMESSSRIVFFTTMTGDMAHRGHVQFLQKVRVWGVLCVMLYRQAISENKFTEEDIGHLFDVVFSRNLLLDKESFVRAMKDAKVAQKDRKLFCRSTADDTHCCFLDAWAYMAENILSPQKISCTKGAVCDIVLHHILVSMRKAEKRKSTALINLVVGITSDSRASSRKRVPACPYVDRATVFGSMDMVDSVVKDDGTSKLEIYEGKFRYDAVFVGSDYLGSQEYEDIFATKPFPRPPVVFIERFPGTSTTDILKRISLASGASPPRLSFLSNSAAGGAILRIGDEFVAKTVQIGTDEHFSGAGGIGPLSLMNWIVEPGQGKKGNDLFAARTEEYRSKQGEEFPSQMLFGDVYGLGHVPGHFPRNWKFAKRELFTDKLPSVSGYNGHREVLANLYFMKHAPHVVTTTSVSYHSNLESRSSNYGVAAEDSDGDVFPVLGQTKARCISASVDRRMLCAGVFSIQQRFAGPTFLEVCKRLYQVLQIVLSQETWLADNKRCGSEVGDSSSGTETPPSSPDCRKLLLPSSADVQEAYLSALDAVAKVVQEVNAHGFVHGDVHETNVCFPHWKSQNIKSSVQGLLDGTSTAVLIDFGWCENSLFCEQRGGGRKGNRAQTESLRQEHRFLKKALEENFDWLHFVGSLSSSQDIAVQHFHHKVGVLRHQATVQAIMHFPISFC